MFHPACGLSECIEWAQELMAEQADTDSILFPPEVEMLPLPTPLRGMRHWKNERATILLRNIAAGYAISEAVFSAGITMMTYYNWRKQHPEFAQRVDELLIAAGRLPYIPLNQRAVSRLRMISAQRPLLELLRMGYGVKPACKKLGISHMTYYYWCKVSLVFRQLAAEAQREALHAR